ncbi:hypothetical protein DJ90_5984 [Paenibacillus macerans]|uniref:Uncharacterized protein n=1 Tax=Paenibacillus macerans TaxID=44252 RepID=A0A090Y5S6_PAEMA|nr:hypothetical protein DJ90_5984 [Paenibacillus macerans]
MALLEYCLALSRFCWTFFNPRSDVGYDIELI